MEVARRTPGPGIRNPSQWRKLREGIRQVVQRELSIIGCRTYFRFRSRGIFGLKLFRSAGQDNHRISDCADFIVRIHGGAVLHLRAGAADGYSRWPCCPPQRTTAQFDTHYMGAVVNLKQSGPLVVELPPGPMTARKNRCVSLALQALFHCALQKDHNETGACVVRYVIKSITHRSITHRGCSAHFLKEGTQ
jgi:hypothetical protein